MISIKEAQNILQAIKKSAHPLIISHEKPDGDTLGSGLALAYFLDNDGIRNKYFCIEKPPVYFNYLPKIERIITDWSAINPADHDLIIIVDCADLDRTGIGEILQELRSQIPIINIDHHQTNNLFGHHNLVMADASSTSEIIYKILMPLEDKIDKYIATSILTGIISDTMNFKNGATTQESLAIASKLLKKGARISQIINNLTQNKSIASLKLWGLILSRLEIEPQFNFAHTVITKKDLDENPVSKEDLDGLANFLSLLQEAEFILLLTEEDDNFIKGSLRTTKEKIDMAEIAASLYGGGHQKSAGFKFPRKNIAPDTHWKNFIINAIINKLANSK